MGFDLTWIEEGLKQPGKTQIGLASALGRAPSMVTDLLKGRRRLKADEVDRIAAYLDVVPPRSLPTEVEIIGIAGAGPFGEVDFSSSQGGLGTAAAQPGATDSTKAVEVRGTSMRPFANDGWLVYYEEDARQPIQSNMIGMPCVCWLADGRVLIKTPFPAGNNTYNLESYNPAIETIRDVVVETASLVTSIVPRPPTRRSILTEKDAA